MNDNPLFTEAFRLMVAGFSVIPCRKDKTPLLGTGEIFPLRTTPADEAQITKWWTDNPDANIGIITGKISGITVIDIDIYKPGAVDPGIFPETYTVKTGRGGFHLYYQYQEGFTISAGRYSHLPGVDIRSDGGYVVAPPSITEFIKDGLTTGGSYGVLKNLPFAPFPIHMFPEPKVTRTITERIGVPDGNRNDSMASFIGSLLKVAKESEWETEVWPAVVIANQTYKPPLEDRVLRSTFESIAKKEREKRGGKTESYEPAISFTELMTMEFPEIRYAIEPFFEQGTVNMITAPPNNWKSWIMLLFAYSISSGSEWVNKFKAYKGKVMLVNEEDSLRSIRNRFTVLGIKEPDLPIYFRVARNAILNTAFVDKLIAEAMEQGVTTILLDSLRAVHDANENDSQEMQRVMNLLKRIVNDGITVIFTHHHRKKPMFGKQDDAEASRGSSGINAAVSGHLLLEEVKREDKTFIIVRHIKSKIGEKLEPFEIEITKPEAELSGNSDSILKFSYAGEFKRAEQTLERVKDEILNALKAGGWRSKKDLQIMGIKGSGSIRQALTDLTKDVIIFKLRKELLSEGIKLESEGHGNEKLYSIKDNFKEDNQDDFDF